MSNNMVLPHSNTHLKYIIPIFVVTAVDASDKINFTLPSITPIILYKLSV